jgi:hypothetical protein
VTLATPVLSELALYVPEPPETRTVHVGAVLASGAGALMRAGLFPYDEPLPVVLVIEAVSAFVTFTNATVVDVPLLSVIVAT